MQCGDKFQYFEIVKINFNILMYCGYNFQNWDGHVHIRLAVFCDFVKIV